LPFGINRALEPRERRTIAVGVTIVALAFVVMEIALPFARRWAARESLIDASRERLARLTAIDGRAADIQAAVQARDVQLTAGRVRLLHARSAALAASSLQAIIREQARESGVAIIRMDVAGTVDSETVPVVPATISAVADIYGLGRFLQGLQHGPRLFDVRELNVASTSALGRGLLQISLTVHAPFVSGE
jgi:type II secretory pathway component PulM